MLPSWLAWPSCCQSAGSSNGCCACRQSCSSLAAVAAPFAGALRLTGSSWSAAGMIARHRFFQE